MTRFPPQGINVAAPSDAIVTETAFDQTSTAGVVATFSRGDHTHGTPASPTIPAASGTVVAETAFGQAPTDGIAATLSKGDHTHGTPASPTIPVASDAIVTETVFDQASTAGVATTFSRGDHTHGTPASPTVPVASGTVVAETAFGQASSVGVAATFSKGDHTHGTPTVPALNDLSDVTITAPAVDEVLRYNGVDWVNGTPAVASPGPGINFYLDSTKIIPAGDGPQTKPLETLSKTPTAGAELDESEVANNNTVPMDQYMYNTALGVTSIDAGEWVFNTYTYVDNAADISEIAISVGRVFIGDGTITITGAGTSRTATVTGGTPFVAGDYNADIVLTGRIITPNAVLMITGFTSTSVVTIECLATYTNEPGAAYSVDRYLFQCTTEEIDNLTVALKTHVTVQQAFATNTTDKLTVHYFARTDHVGNVTIHLLHNGTDHYSHVHTPLSTKHNDLVGLQGGVADQYYHLTSSEYTGTGTGNFARKTSPTLVTPILGDATATTVNKVTITTPATSAVLTIADGVTLSVPSNATLSGTNTGDQTLASLGAVGVTDVQTVTNKRITPRVGTIVDSATPTPAGDGQDMFTVTALAQTAIFGAPTGTPTDGQKLIIRIKDNGTARALSWNVTYRAIGATLPTTTVISKTVYIGLIYNGADSKWDCVAVSQEV